VVVHLIGGAANGVLEDDAPVCAARVSTGEYRRLYCRRVCGQASRLSVTRRRNGRPSCILNRYVLVAQTMWLHPSIGPPIFLQPGQI
jgi:hypothetical protein